MIPLVVTASGEYKPSRQGIKSRGSGAVFIEAGKAPEYEEDSESD